MYKKGHCIKTNTNVYNEKWLSIHTKLRHYKSTEKEILKKYFKEKENWLEKYRALNRQIRTHSYMRIKPIKLHGHIKSKQMSKCLHQI